MFKTFDLINKYTNFLFLLISLQAFFREERLSLQRRRQVLRLLQQRKITDVSTLKDLALPEQIPLQLVIGTKVILFIYFLKHKILCR